MENKGQKLWLRAKALIPGGNQLLSKRAEMFLPDQWPAYYTKAKGAHIWDLDGRKYLDMSIMGIGACPLGYADPDVNRAVKEAVSNGSMATLNAPEEVELAELLCAIHPWADMVRYARTGGEAMAIAVRVARAHTGRDTIAFCGYHGWADWYLATNLQDEDGLTDHLLSGLVPRGVPKGLAGTVRPFHYNKLEELEAIARNADGTLAAIVMEPIHGVQPDAGFLEGVRRIADRTGAVLVFDEITVGWKLTWGGAHLLFGVAPDIAVFSKGMSNGFPMAAIIGRRAVMQSAQETFISSTYWSERIGPVAALATIHKMKRVNLSAVINEKAVRVRATWESAAQRHGIAITCSVVPVLLTISFDGADGAEAKTLFVQELLQRGILASGLCNLSLAHSDADLRRYARAVDAAFRTIADARRTGGIARLLKGPVAHSHFARLA